MHASTLSLATSMPTTTRSFCAIIHSLPCSVRAQRPLQLFGLRKTPELSLALTQAHRPLGATGSAPATGGSDPTARSHILTDLPDTRAQGMPDAGRTRELCVQRNVHFTHASNTGQPGHPAFPARWLYGLYVVSSV